MPPKAEITKDKILNAAFEIMREQGIDALTARTVAQKLKCSTQPIYSVYEHMEAVKLDAFRMAVDFALSCIKQYEDRKNEPAMNLGIGFLLFAKNEKQLFRSVCLSDQAKYDHGKLRKEMYAAFLQLDSRFAEVQESKLKSIFIKLNMYLLGIGTMINTNTLEVTIGEAEEMIVEMYEALLSKEGIAAGGH